VKYPASICLALVLAIPMTSPAFVGGFALTLVAVGAAHAEPVKPGTAKKGCSIGVTGASGAQGELLFDDGDTVTVKKADGTTQKFKCSDGTWVVALTANPTPPSFDFDFKASFAATEEEVSRACDDAKGVPTSGGSLTLELNSTALATSGRDRRRWRRDDRELHHLIDPATGVPSESDLLRLTVVARDAVDAEVWAKALYLVGEHEAVREADERGLPCVLVTRDGRTRLAGGLA